ncbi:MucR family transcriptional regulator [Sphingomonas hylomeconis]|uniref:MucR family transcriptional regulator n=1 Tax=Sphingomonas hylomeconis TaxID=1395958 RepID=A0ABV7SQY0_9SPHN|nr:MucR family transcriptional regulator [Sphingomonas hylomeconis]
MSDNKGADAVAMAAELTIAWLSNGHTRVAADDVPAFLMSMHEALSSLAAPVSADTKIAAQTNYTGALTERKSLASRDHIISLIDGKPYKALRRHLSKHGLTPTEYRKRYNLKHDYPMVAPAYSERRRDIAMQTGLGLKSRPLDAV